MRSPFAGFAFLIAIAGCVTAAAQASSEALSLEGWTISGPGKLSATEAGAIEIRYESPQFEGVVVRPPEAIPLPQGTEQVRFWCARMDGDFDLRVLLRDARGVEHVADTMSSRPEFPAVLRSKMKEWSVWRQVETVSLVATGRVEDRVQPEFLELARRLNWPQPLAISGIEIRPARDRRDNEAFFDGESIKAGKGRLWLAELQSGVNPGLRAQFNWFLEGRWRWGWGWDSHPRLFLDDFTRRSGFVRYRVEVRKGYQGPLVGLAEATAEFDRTQAPSLLARRVELPELSPGRYFLVLKSWRPSGELERDETMELFVIAGKPGSIPPLAAPFEWVTGQRDHVFRANATEANLVLKCDTGAWPGRSNPAKCVIRAMDWRGGVIAESEHGKAEDIQIRCKGLKEGTDYLATAEFHDGDKVLDRVTLHFGVASREREMDSGHALPALPTRDELLLSRQPTPIAELYGSAFGGKERGQPANAAELLEMDDWFQSLPRLGFKLGSIMFGWGECEPLPGVFRWDEIERRVAMAQRLEVRMFLTPTLWGDPLEWPRWIEFQPSLDQFGYAMQPGRSGVVEPALADPIRKQGAEHWLRAVAMRFRDNPNVVGYRVKPLNLHGDNKPQATRPDFAPVTQSAFGDGAQRRGAAASLTPLFLLPGQNPQRSGPDLSQGWQQFMEFRVHAYEESVRSLLSAIRAVDPKRQIHIYRSSTPTACEAAIPLLSDGAEFHDEGGPFYFQRAVESMCLQAGIPYTNEGHQFTPPSLAMIDAGFFYGSTFDRGWCWLYRWNSRRHEDPRFAALPKVMEFERNSQPALREWVGAEGDEPEILVFGSRADRLLGSMKTGFYSDIAGVDVFAALFAYHQVRAHFADEFTTWVEPGRFKCVFAVGEIMTAAAIERLDAYARGGGKLVLIGEAGRLSPERPEERDLLRRRLAGLPNVKWLPLPVHEPPPPGLAFRASQAFNESELDAVLTWAAVDRVVKSETPGFECVRKRLAKGERVYVAVFRRFPGEYDNIWYDAKTEQRWGRQPAHVVVGGLAAGEWRLEKFHRASRSLGTIRPVSGKAEFDTEPVAVGELQLFRLTRKG